MKEVALSPPVGDVERESFRAAPATILELPLTALPHAATAGGADRELAADEALVHRGGLRADILDDGRFSVGDEIFV